MEMEEGLLTIPLLEPIAVSHPPELSSFPNTATTFSILIRYCLVFFIGVISIWANHEAGKGYAVTVINQSEANSIAGRRFQLFYMSNDAATRTIITATKLVEEIYYSDQDPKHIKVRSIILKLVDRKLIENDVVVEKGYGDEFVVKICPSVMEGHNFKQAFHSAVLRGVTRILHRDGRQLNN